jgi:hypothetical protein
MIRGEPAIGRDQSREPRLYSVEPVWGLDHEAVIRFCGQGSEAAYRCFDLTRARSAALTGETEPIL